MNTANPYGSAPTHHMLSVLVQNKPGVLARVASLFARRGYNIFSLAVAPTDDPEFSRISIVVDVESAPLEQIVKQLFKLIEVVRISELDPRKSVERELMVATIRAHPRAARSGSGVGQYFRRQNPFRWPGRNHSVHGRQSRKLDDFSDLLRQYGIIESQRTRPRGASKARPRRKEIIRFNHKFKNTKERQDHGSKYLLRERC
jgi:acetolactate synthase I/III small subunit